MVRGYHEYQAIWSDPYVGEELICEREVGNSHDPQAVVLKKEIDGDLRIVGHVPRRISSSCSIFIRRGGSIKCSITGSRRYSSDLPQGGLEIPCILIFTTKCAELRDKTTKVLESVLSVKVREMDLATQNCTPKAEIEIVPPQAEPQVQIKKEPAELPASNSSVDLTGMMDNCMAISPVKKNPNCLILKKS